MNTNHPHRPYFILPFGYLEAGGFQSLEALSPLNGHKPHEPISPEPSENENKAKV